MFRLTSFLKRSPALSRAEFVKRWQDLSTELLGHPDVKKSVRRVVINLPFETIPEEFVWIAADDFDGAGELWFDTVETAVETCNRLNADPALRQAFTELVDEAGCISWIGHVVHDFDGPGVEVKRMVAGQIAPHLELEAAQQYWLTGHNAFFKGFPEFMAYMLRYMQVTGIPTPDLQLPSYHFFAMHADVGFHSLQDLSDAYREPTHAAVMMTDIVKFGATSGAITYTADKELILFDDIRTGERGVNVDTPNAHWTTATNLGVNSPATTTESHVSPSRYAAEREAIYRRVWLMVGRVEAIPEGGDYFLRPVPTLDVEALVVRGKDDIIRAFYNSCSHRGVTVVNQPCGNAATFRCPYHSWLYGADGSLRSIPADANFPFIDKSQHGLKPIHSGYMERFHLP